MANIKPIKSERNMHVNECFALAFSRPAAADALDETNVIGNPIIRMNSNDRGGDHDFLSDNITSPEQQQQRQEEQLVEEGSILSMLHCIVAEWVTKSKTNFYIPPEHYPGYSYLFEHENEEQAWHSFGDKIRHHHHHVHHTAQHSHLHHEHHHNKAFVYAEEPNNLHPHHYDVYMHGTMNSTIHSSPQHSISSISNIKDLHHPITLSQQQQLSNGNANHNHPGMTVPYYHPHLEIPVPPLQLPWYFGALCFSFALAGIVILSFPHQWTRRHWFPFQKFAWTLILLQSPCSFLADYIHMTNISPWHTIDRLLACILMSLEVVKVVAMRPHTRPSIYLLYLMCIVGAVFCFLRSQASQETLNAEGFIFWHCGWHCYPIACIGVLMGEHYLNRKLGEYSAFECEPENDMNRNESYECRKGEEGGILLSTIVMKNVDCLESMQGRDLLKATNNDIGVDTPKKMQKTAKSKAESSGQNRTPVASPRNTSKGLQSPLRRSRRIAGQTPEVR